MAARSPISRLVSSMIEPVHLRQSRAAVRNGARLGACEKIDCVGFCFSRKAAAGAELPLKGKPLGPRGFIHSSEAPRRGCPARLPDQPARDAPMFAALRHRNFPGSVCRPFVPFPALHAVGGRPLACPRSRAPGQTRARARPRRPVCDRAGHCLLSDHGVAADAFDRRRLMLMTQAIMACSPRCWRR